MKQFDVIVAGAGIIGVCSALYLQMTGRNVCLIDKMQPGQGTSFGNAGLIERSSVIPYSFPRQFNRILSYAFNQRSDVRFDWSYLPQIAPWLFQFWQASAPNNLKKAAEALLPLIEASVIEHDFLSQKANATSLIEPKGWLEVYHHQAAFEQAKQEAAQLAPYHLNFDILDSAKVSARIPIAKKLAGAIHWLDPKTVNDPGGLTAAYGEYFTQQGGKFLTLDAFNAHYRDSCWIVEDNNTSVTAPELVVALGANSALFLKQLGYRNIPFAIKRGYHKHYHLQDNNAVLDHSLCDPHAGFVLAPMRQGIRLTTGIEFAAYNAPANSIQIMRAEKIARTILPLGEAIEEQPWLGQRPCLADMRPVIGKAPHHQGLWLNFGHAHHGLTLGPVSGKLLSQMMSGQPTLTNANNFSLSRFIKT